MYQPKPNAVVVLRRGSRNRVDESSFYTILIKVKNYLKHKPQRL